MHFSKKVVIFTLTLAVLNLPFLAQAQIDKLSPILNNFLYAVTILVGITFVLALFVFAWGIVRFIYAAGDPTEISKAKGYILWGLVGIAVLASTYGIIVWLRAYFGVSGGGGYIQVPVVI